MRSRTHADLRRHFIKENDPTLEEILARPEVVGSAHWVSVGMVDDIVADSVKWFEAGAMDGFIALPGGSTGSLNLFFDELVPELVRRDLFGSDYEGTTLRDHLDIENRGCLACEQRKKVLCQICALFATRRFEYLGSRW